MLLEHGGDPDCCTNSGYTPLHLAAFSGNVDCVRVLLDNNADSANRDEHGNTPLQTAELSSKHNVIKVLRSAGKCIACIYVWYCGYILLISVLKEMLDILENHYLNASSSTIYLIDNSFITYLYCTSIAQVT